MQFIIKIKLKDYLNSKNMRMSNDFSDELEKKIKEIIDKAIERARLNGRSTVMPRDL